LFGVPAFSWPTGRLKAGSKLKKAVLKENERGDCQVALLLGLSEMEMQPILRVPWVLAAD